MTIIDMTREKGCDNRNFFILHHTQSNDAPHWKQLLNTPNFGAKNWHVCSCTHRTIHVLCVTECSRVIVHAKQKEMKYCGSVMKAHI